MTQEVFLTEHVGLLEAAHRDGLQIDWNGPQEAERQRQVELIQASTKRRDYGIVVTPAGGSAVDTTVEDALHVGIPVVLLRDTTTLQEQPHLSFVLEDYVAGAQLVLARLRQRFACSGTVVILGADNYSENSVRRLDALETALREGCPELHIADPIVAPFGSGYVQVAAKQAAQAYPDLIGFVALNARAGLAAEAIVETLNSHIAVISYDQSLPLLLRLRRGFVDSIVSQNMRGMGEQAVNNVVSDRMGKSYEHFLRLQPMLVTRDNVDLASTQNWLQLNLPLP